jgi:Zn-dependent peptidase ImmA (M78 family)
VFAPNGRAKIEISRSLTDAAETDSAARRRYRTTLAHEIGHAVCHPQLFMEDSFTRRLFGNQQAAARETSKILCRETEVGQFKYKGEWWEYQANQCMAALLLPVRLFREATERAMSGLGFVSFEDAIRSGRADALVRELSDFFDVSQEAVFYRLDHLGFVPKSGEARLPL